ncbi:MAG: methyltransferase domain-containing protein [Candidatus Jacksonbacteria bacterium]
MIILDRLLKALAVNYNGFFVIGNKEFGASFGTVKNFGIALSINLPLIIVILFSAFILAYLSWMLYGRHKDMPKIQVIIFVLIIAGGLSNVFDRLIYGYVVDYWSIFLFEKSLAFNLADAMIVIAVLMFGAESLRKALMSKSLEIGQRILSLNQAVYDKIAADFSQTREKPLWPEALGFKKYVKTGNRVLDIGCGSGRLLQLFDKIKVDYVGVDASQKLLEQAKSWNMKHETWNKGSIKNFLKMNMIKLRFNDNSFDVIFMIASLNHLPACYHQQALSEAFRVLKPGGHLLMTNFNLWRFSLKDKTVWKYKSFKNVMTNWNGHPLYYYAFTLRELKRKCKKAGFKIKTAYYAKDGRSAHFWNGRNIVVVGGKGIRN